MTAAATVATPPTTRPYLVLDMDTGKAIVVRASTEAQAIRHVARARYSATIAKPEDIARLSLSGPVVFEDARATEAAEAANRG